MVEGGGLLLAQNRKFLPFQPFFFKHNFLKFVGKADSKRIRKKFWNFFMLLERGDVSRRVLTEIGKNVFVRFTFSPAKFRSNGFSFQSRRFRLSGGVLEEIVLKAVFFTSFLLKRRFGNPPRKPLPPQLGRA